MIAKWGKRVAAIVILVLIVAGTVYAMLPQPVGVDIAIVDRGPLAVTIDEEGIASIRDVFRVSAPIAGKVDRLPVEVGDRVHRGTTTVATIHPTDPPFLDVRTRRELEAAIGSARASVELAKAQVASAEAGQRLAQSIFDRAQKLVVPDTISISAVEKAVADLDNANGLLQQAKAGLALRESELSSAQARLIEPDQLEGDGTSCCLTLRAPVDGIVLKLASESEQVVGAGAELLEIGDPRDMEIVVHLLSSDAAALAPGAPARLDDWGGRTLSARVRRVDPAGYTKVSALGIEEQRVDVRLDLADPQADWARLGHDFRVMVHIVTWEGSNVIRLPIGALFRKGSEWSVYRIVNGRAVASTVVIGHRNSSVAEVIDGLAEGDTVVLHPSDRVVDGAKVEMRQ